MSNDTLHDFDDLETFGSTDEPPREMDARQALVSAALKGVDTRSVRQALKSAVPHVVVIATPSTGWSSAFAQEISRAYSNTVAVHVSERKKDGNTWAVDLMSEKLRRGQHMVICTHDLSLLPVLVRVSADTELTIPGVDAALLRRAISYMTSRPARGKIDAAAARLDFPLLQLALRSGSSAKDCLVRLHQASRAIQSPDTGVKTGLKLDDLPLSADIAAWAYDTVEQLQAVGTGELSPDALRYGVLTGEPGTGKTLLAQAIAATAGWTFHTATIGDWFTSSDGNLGGVSKACTRFFDTLLETDQVVGFIDELDSLPSRSSLEAKDLQWWGTVINLMLTQIDRLRQSGKKIFLISATNWHGRLDPALVRHGRYEQRIEVRAPSTAEEVQAVFAHYLRDDIPSQDLLVVSILALGATPAMIAGWVRTARGAARSDKRSVTVQDLLAAAAPADKRSDDEIMAVALHEAGHAVTAIALGLKVAMVTIIPRGSAGGVTQLVDTLSTPNRDELEAMVTMMLGGRAADLVLGEKGAHAGAATDLKMATALLTQGMNELGLYTNLAHGTKPGHEVSGEVEAIMKRLLQRAVNIVTIQTAAVEKLTSALLDSRLLRTEQIMTVVDPFLVDMPQNWSCAAVRRPFAGGASHNLVVGGCRS